MEGRVLKCLLVTVFGLTVTVTGGMTPAAEQAEQLVIYSGRGERFTRPVARAFEARSGIKVQALVGPPNQLLVRIQEEGARTPADVFISTSVGVLELAREGNLLQSHSSPAVDRLPAAFRGPENKWFGASLRVRAVVYRKGRVDPSAIQSILDLAKPEWEGKLAITVSTNASFIGGVAAMVAQHGEPAVRAFLKGIRRNAGVNVFPGHTPIVSAVARGEVELGLINHYYFYRAIAKDAQAPIGIVFLDQNGAGAPVLIAGLAILKEAKHPEAARQFVDFVLSEAGQKVFAEVNYEFPTNPAVPAHALLPPRAGIKLAPMAATLDAGKIDRAIDLIKAAGMR